MEVANKSIWITSIHCAAGKIYVLGRENEENDSWVTHNISKSWRTESGLNGHNGKYKA